MRVQVNKEKVCLNIYSQLCQASGIATARGANAAKARMNYAKTGCEVIKKEAKKWEFNNLCLP